MTDPVPLTAQAERIRAFLRPKTRDGWTACLGCNYLTHPDREGRSDHAPRCKVPGLLADIATLDRDRSPSVDEAAPLSWFGGPHGDVLPCNAAGLHAHPPNNYSTPSVDGLDVERLYAAILDELVVLWGEPSDAVSVQVRPIVARSIAERYRAATPTPALDADRHLPDCDAPGPDEPCTCVSRADPATPSVDGLRERILRLSDASEGRGEWLLGWQAAIEAAADLAATPTPAAERKEPR